ncbi:DUF3048 domain-containing protein [Streptomyces sp. NPDC005485]|uniref:DUF3048 domain-containing protein n=1 Tax=Streptomyces sp. NPDC005485 TaxID=3155591 RepID=UPI0033AD9A72
MRQVARVRRSAMTAALLTAAVVGSLSTGCTVRGGGVDDGRGRGQGQGESEGTGQDNRTAPSGGSVLAVKIDNVSAARPQTGLDAADIVYAEQVEGGLSRLMAVYATQLPKSVGPVRSARESDLELLRQFDDPTLAFSGAQHKLLPLIDKAPLHARPADSGTDGFYRGADKPAPHNLYLHPQQLVGTAAGSGALTTGFHYGAAPAGGSPESERTVRFPSARFTFTWSTSRSRWLVSMDGTPTVLTSGKRVAPATVVVQHVKVRASKFHDYLGNNTPYTETVGAGKAEVLRDGQVFDVGWKRATATGGTEFTTADGAPMNFAKGQVWVIFAKA